MENQDVSFPTLSIHQFDESGEKHEYYVNTFSDHIKKHHAHVLVPHRHDFYVFVYFTKGTGFHEIDFVRFSIEAGATFFLQPGQLHHWEFSEETEGFVVLHSKAFFDINIAGLGLDKLPFYASKLNTPKLFISDQSKGNVAVLPDLLKEFIGNAIFKHSMCATLISQLYIDLARIYLQVYPEKHRIASAYNSKFQKLESIIDFHFMDQKRVEFYAEALAISTRHLNRICQQIANKSFTQILTERVMLEARHLLTSTDYSFTEIAFQLGYDEYSYFSKLFKQYCGMNLRDFRNSRM